MKRLAVLKKSARDVADFAEFSAASLRRHYPDQVKGSGALISAISAGNIQHPASNIYLEFHSAFVKRAGEGRLLAVCIANLYDVRMKLICLDLEGVLVPEIWIAFSRAAGIKELSRTTRDEPDYDKLMAFRLDILKREGYKLADIQNVIAGMTPLDGAVEFTARLRSKTQLIILSDTFEQFAAPLMKQLGYPTLFCNTLVTSADGAILSWKLRQKNGKKEAVRAFISCNCEVFAAGDSFNDLEMIEEAGAGCLFRAPPAIVKAYPHIPGVDSYGGLMERIDLFLAKR